MYEITGFARDSTSFSEFDTQQDTSISQVHALHLRPIIGRQQCQDVDRNENANTIASNGYRSEGARCKGIDCDDSDNASAITLGLHRFEMYKLEARKTIFDVDVNDVLWWANGAHYFVQMDAVGGKPTYDTYGARHGAGYSDAQSPHDLKWVNSEASIRIWAPVKFDPDAGLCKYGTCCTELGAWELNSIRQAQTIHSCTTNGRTRREGVGCGDNADAIALEAYRFEGVCYKNGCDAAPSRPGDNTSYGPGSNFEVDATKPFTHVTELVPDNGADYGNVNEVHQYYAQDGITIETPTVAQLTQFHHHRVMPGLY